MSNKDLSPSPMPRHRLHIEILGQVEAVVAPGTEDPQDVAAFIYGQPGERPLVRIHSRCLYGDVFGSHECDCHSQLVASMHLIKEAGAGMIIYLNQEGRGAGLYRKAQGYELTQRLGIDSFEAYEALEVSSDSRQYTEAAEMLKSLGVRALRLITNNPAKIKAMEKAGLDVERERLDLDALGFPIPEEAKAYVESKRKRGHLL